MSLIDLRRNDQGDFGVVILEMDELEKMYIMEKQDCLALMTIMDHLKGARNVQESSFNILAFNKHLKQAPPTMRDIATLLNSMIQEAGYTIQKEIDLCIQ